MRTACCETLGWRLHTLKAFRRVPLHRPAICCHHPPWWRPRRPRPWPLCSSKACRRWSGCFGGRSPRQRGRQRQRAGPRRRRHPPPPQPQSMPSALSHMQPLSPLVLLATAPASRLKEQVGRLQNTLGLLGLRVLSAWALVRALVGGRSAAHPARRGRPVFPSVGAASCADAAPLRHPPSKADGKLGVAKEASWEADPCGVAQPTGKAAATGGSGRQGPSCTAIRVQVRRNGGLCGQ